MTLKDIVKKYNSCAFLYDPSINITLPKFKILIVYKDTVIKVLGCNILVRSDLDKVALYFVKKDAAVEDREIKNYSLCIHKINPYATESELVARLKFNEHKYIFEMI